MLIRKAMHVEGARGIGGTLLYLPLNFSVNQKMVSKKNTLPFILTLNKN